MTIDSVSTIPAAGTGSASKAGAGSAAATEDRFLRLLVAQMRNQDPLNPLDNAQITSQMAQLSTVSGLEKINATLTGMISSLAAQQGIAAAGLVGTEVAVQGDGIAWSGSPARGAYSITQAAAGATVAIKDDGGKVVRTIELGPQTAGMRGFTWDGKDDAGKAVPTGSYTFSIEATQAGRVVPVTTLSVGTVRGVIPAADGFALDLGALGIVPFGAVAQILSKPDEVKS